MNRDSAAMLDQAALDGKAKQIDGHDVLLRQLVKKLKLPFDIGAADSANISLHAGVG